MEKAGTTLTRLTQHLERISLPPRLTTLAARLALAASFLSAVADRLGLWGAPGSPGVVWGDYESFLDYSQTLMPVLPTSVADALATLATVLEVLFAALLLAGIRLRWVALGSALLLGLFALSMSLTGGPKPALDYSVWSAGAGALLLAGAARGASDEHPSTIGSSQ